LENGMNELEQKITDLEDILRAQRKLLAEATSKLRWLAKEAEALANANYAYASMLEDKSRDAESRVAQHLGQNS